MPKHLPHLLFAYVLPILLILCFLLLFSFKFFAIFQSLPYITGYDNPTHLATIEVYTKTIFPSLWGWVPNWYAGMPLPLFYPPAAYYLGSLLLPFFSSAVTFYKIYSYLLYILAAIVSFIVLKKIFSKELEPNEHEKAKVAGASNAKKYLSIFSKQIPVVLAVVTIFSFNPGAPSTNAMSDGILSHQFAMIWLIVGTYCLFKQKPFYYVLSIISWMMIILSNTHAFLTGTLFLFFLCLLWPFAYPDGQKARQFFLQTRRTVLIHISAILASACWVFPMLVFYRFFTGIHIMDPSLSTRFFASCWIILVVSGLGIFIANYEDKHKLRQIYLAIFASFGFLFLIEIIQRVWHTNLGLPIQLWRWYETLFWLCSIPLCHVFIFFIKRIKYLSVGVLLLICIITAMRHVNFHAIYGNYRQDQIDRLVQKVGSETGAHDLVLVHGRGYPAFTRLRQMTIDARLGANGNSTTFSNLRESSINAIFLRIAKKFVSRAEEDWALINFAQSTTLKKSDLERQAALLEFLGIKKVVLSNDDLSAPSDVVDITSIKSYKIDKSFPGFSILTSKKEISRASYMQGPLTLLFLKDGFKDREKIDPTYTRFQETAFEKSLYRKSISFAPNNPLIENNEKEILLSKYIVIANIQTKDIDKVIEIFRRALKTNPEKVIYILTEDTIGYKTLAKVFADNKQVQFIRPINARYPFNETVDAIIKNEKNLKEYPATVTFMDNALHLRTPTSTAFKTNKTPTDISNQKFWFIRQSYFPGWKAINNKAAQPDTYLASPGYTMVLQDDNAQELSLYFETPRIVIVSHIISLITLLSILGYAIAAYITSKKTSPHRSL